MRWIFTRWKGCSAWSNGVRAARPVSNPFKYSAEINLGSRRSRHLVEGIAERDGLRATMLMLDGAVQDFNFAARIRDVGLLSTQFFLSPVPNVTYSACLVSKIEQMFTSGKAPYPIQRTLLTSGILESCLDSRAKGNQRLPTPHLAVAYEAPAESQYSRA